MKNGGYYIFPAATLAAHVSPLRLAAALLARCFASIFFMFRLMFSRRDSNCRLWSEIFMVSPFSKTTTCPSGISPYICFQRHLWYGSTRRLLCGLMYHIALSLSLRMYIFPGSWALCGTFPGRKHVFLLRGGTKPLMPAFQGVMPGVKLPEFGPLALPVSPILQRFACMALSVLPHRWARSASEALCQFSRNHSSSCIVHLIITGFVFNLFDACHPGVQAFSYRLGNCFRRVLLCIFRKQAEQLLSRPFLACEECLSKCCVDVYYVHYSLMYIAVASASMRLARPLNLGSVSKML